jgi:hypothetical protein
MPLLSTCVENAFHSLEEAAAERPLGTEDIFLHVARFGTGASTAQLRAHGITPERIDEMLGQPGRERAAEEAGDGSRGAQQRAGEPGEQR